MDNSIVNKVKNLLNKTVENGSSVHEAASSAALAQKLIEKYNLSMAEVDSFSMEEKVEDHGGIFSSGRVSTWKSALANAVAKSNNCKIYINRGRKSSVNIIGRKTDVQIVDYVVKVMSREIERLCKLEQKRQGGHGRVWANNFKLGAVSAINSKLEEAKREVRRTAGTSAIVAVDNRAKEVENWAEKNLNLRKNASSKYTPNSSAWNAGHQAGQSIHANSGLNSGKSNKRLG